MCLKTVVYKYLKFMERSRGTAPGMSTFTCVGVVSVAIYICQLPDLSLNDRLEFAR
jgi:hypothetical protein